MKPPLRIDVNCDMGESLHSYRFGEDRKVIPYTTSANIACVFYAGPPGSISRTMELAARLDVAVGAPPQLSGPSRVCPGPISHAGQTGKLISIKREEILLAAQPLCMHSDTPGARQFAATIRECPEKIGKRR